MITLPKEFVDYTSQLFGEERWRRFVQAMDEPSPVSIRTNPWKCADGEVAEGEETVPWCKDAYWLKERPQFTLDPLLHAGVYYVQEAGSMFLDRVLRHTPYIREMMEEGQINTALDLCAAPGGKSTLIRAALPEGAVLFSNEPDHKRANILMENMQKQGHQDVYVTNGYARDYKKAKMMFDLIVTDVPCSGEGMFRKDAGAIGEWSMANVMKCASLQRSIIEDVWPCLRDGGVLVYSTCTFNLQEDEENVKWILDNYDAELLDVPVEKEWNISGSLLEGFDGPVYRFIPGTTRSEGLFMAVIRKAGEAKATQKPSVKQIKALRVLSDGHPAGTAKGKDIIPDHAEALLCRMDGTKYKKVEVGLDEARRYLHREAIALPEDTPRGFVLICYNGHPLGFMKNIGNRANNLYPKEWAIRVLNI